MLPSTLQFVIAMIACAINERRAIREYLLHYHGERNHQGFANVLLTRVPPPANTNASVLRREHLGGLLNYYYRGAA